jgi:hypothetical protein
MKDDADPVVVTPHVDGDRVVFDWQQPGWKGLLDGVQTIRDNRLTRPMQWGVAELEIPVGMLHFLKKKYPELGSPDAQIKTRAWKRFLASPQSKPFRTRGRGGYLNRSFGGLPNGGQSPRTDELSKPHLPDRQGDGPATDQSLCGGEADISVID